MKKYLVLLLAVLALLSFAVKSTIVVGTTDKIKILDPAKAYDYFSSNILQNIMVGLVDYKIGTSEIVPKLATGWEVSEDGLTYIFHIRKDAKFEDGTPIDAKVIAWSLNRAMKLNGDPAFLLTDVVKSVEAVDDYTLKVVLKQPDVTFISRLGYTVAYPVNPKEYPEDGFFNGAPHMSASGPYKIAEWVRDVKIVLEENPNYFGEKPKTKRVVIMFYDDAATLRLALETGEIDVAYRHLDPRDFLDLKNSNFVKTYEGDSPQIRYFVINVKKPPFDNVLVRRAIAYAVDRQRIVDDVFAGLARPLYSMIPMGMWGHEDVFPKRDLDKARELLKEAGYSEANPLNIDLWYTPTHYGLTEADVAQVLKEALEETGMIKVTIKYAEWSTYIDYFLNGQMGLFLLGWYPDYLDPDDYISPFLGTEGAKSLGSFYSDPQMDEWIVEARKYTDIEKRKEFYHKIQLKLAQDVPYIPLWQGVATAASLTNVKGVLLEPTQIFRYYISYAE
jgi:peptide/nickel transport system substrate-binding protein